jgi:predicted ATP-grasp superfamily ATP-dependent carboligase
MRVLVTDGNERAALAITRSLGRRGVAVIVGAESPDTLAASSRYCSRAITYPSPYHDCDGFNRFLLAAAERERVDVVVPVSEVTTHLVARNRPLRRSIATTAPAFDAFDRVSDKWHLLECAVSRGIPIPRTTFVSSAAALGDRLDDVSFPVVVKPARSRVLTDAGWRGATVHYAGSRTELLRLYRTVDYLALYPTLIQERVTGPGLGIFLLCDGGRPRAVFAHRRLREHPPAGGVSVLSESVPVDPALLERSLRLLQPLAWTGVAMVEFKEDTRTGRTVLMEINGRFWGSLQLAIDAGVDFPYLSCRLALGERIDDMPPFTIGVQGRWLLGDVDHLLCRLLHSNRYLDLRDDAPSRGRVLLDFLKFRGGRLTYDVFRGNDPRPFACELRQKIRELSASAKGGCRRLVRRARQPQPCAS